MKTRKPLFPSAPVLHLDEDDQEEAMRLPDLPRPAGRVVLLFLVAALMTCASIGLSVHGENGNVAFSRVEGTHRDPQEPLVQPTTVAKKVPFAEGRGYVFKAKSVQAPVCTPLNSKDVSITLVTQCDQTRLWMMKHHCQRWTGPISLAVYTKKSRRTVLASLEEMGCQNVTLRNHRSSNSMVDYPINHLRNIAFSAVQTSHALYVDIDFWPGANLHHLLLRHRDYLAQDHRHALTLAAFSIKKQCRGRLYCPKQFMPLTRQDVKQGLDSFRIFNSNKGQGSTRFDDWIQRQAADELVPIECFHSNRYEPFLVVRYCQDLPPFQAEFVGYGKNKISWVMQLRRSGWTFAQPGEAFLVDFPGPKSPAFVVWINGTGSEAKPLDEAYMMQTKRGLTDQMFVQFRDWLDHQYHPEMARTPFCQDALHNDDSLLWIPRH